MMTLPRDLIAQALIVLALCVGGWLMLVKPQIDELAQVEQELTTHTTNAGTLLNREGVEDAARRVSAIKARISEIDASNELASDSSRLYGMIMNLADSHAVQVRSLQPGSAKQPNEGSKVTITRINVAVEGEYEKVAAFLEAVGNLSAFVRPLALQVNPSHSVGRTTVDVNFACDVLSFALADSLAELRGVQHAQP